MDKWKNKLWYIQWNIIQIYKGNLESRQGGSHINPTYLGGRDWEDEGQTEERVRPPPQQMRQVLWHMFPRYVGGMGRKIPVQEQPQAKSMRPYLKNN
jgi:hypothetical protein